MSNVFSVVLAAEDVLSFPVRREPRSGHRGQEGRGGEDFSKESTSDSGLDKWLGFQQVEMRQKGIWAERMAGTEVQRGELWETFGSWPAVLLGQHSNPWG